YLQAFDEKLAAFFTPVRPARYDQRRQGRDRSARYGQRPPASPRLVVSDTLRNSRLLKPGLSVDATPREAAIIVTLVNHPGLIESRMEALAALDFASPTTRAIMNSVLDLVGHDHDIT